MKIKITKEQFELLEKQSINHCFLRPSFNASGAQSFCIEWIRKSDPDFTIDINEDQIIKELSNREKWKKVLKSETVLDELSLVNVSVVLDCLGYDATEAHKKVVGDE